jgi:hypothetical protein
MRPANRRGVQDEILVIAMLVLIVGSLGSALWFLIRDKGNSDRTVKALHGTHLAVRSGCSCC